MADITNRGHNKGQTLETADITDSHCEIIVQLGYDSGHIVNPFTPLFYPLRSEQPAPFHLMCPRIDKQKILDPL